jgi:hypothetical protein
MKPIVATFAPMKKHSAGDRDFARHIPLAIFGVVTALFLARPLFGFGTLLPIDIIDGAAPWKAAAPGGEPHNAFLSDTLDVHTHFANQSQDIRSGASSWRDRSIGGGIPSLKAGFSPLMWLYLVVPAWYAPGLVAAARTLLAAGLSYGFLRELRTNRVAATVGGVAYCISGYMVGWAGWPHSNVAAFLPGLFWAVERIVREPSLRRSVPVALVVAAMVVSNFPVVTIYGLLGAGFYALWRLGGCELGDSTTTTRLRHALRAALVATWGGRGRFTSGESARPHLQRVFQLGRHLGTPGNPGRQFHRREISHLGALPASIRVSAHGRDLLGRGPELGGDPVVRGDGRSHTRRGRTDNGSPPKGQLR